MFRLYFNLGESIPNVTDWIQAIAAVGVLILTGLMACYAKQALNTWRSQKHYDIYISCLAQYNGYAFLISNYIYNIIGYLRANMESKDLTSFNNFLMNNLDNPELLKKVETIELIKQIRSHDADCARLYDLYYFLHNTYGLVNDCCLIFLKDQDFSQTKKEKLIKALKEMESANQSKIEDFRNIQNPSAN